MTCAICGVKLGGSYVLAPGQDGEPRTWCLTCWRLILGDDVFPVMLPSEARPVSPGTHRP